jgi:hypothetical protein
MILVTKLQWASLPLESQARYRYCFGCLHGIEYGCPEIRLGVITTWFHQTGDTWTNQLEIDVILPKHSVAWPSPLSQRSRATAHSVHCSSWTRIAACHAWGMRRGHQQDDEVVLRVWEGNTLLAWPRGPRHGCIILVRAWAYQASCWTCGVACDAVYAKQQDQM